MRFDFCKSPIRSNYSLAYRTPVPHWTKPRIFSVHQSAPRLFQTRRSISSAFYVLPHLCNFTIASHFSMPCLNVCLFSDGSWSHSGSLSTQLLPNLLQGPIVMYLHPVLLQTLSHGLTLVVIPYIFVQMFGFFFLFFWRGAGFLCVALAIMELAL